MTTILATYCSWKKNDIAKPVSAINLYNSDRITAVSKAARSLDLPFFILSGKYGLISSEEVIEFYDHLLTDVEVEKHVALVVKQIKANQISSILLFINSNNIDPLNKAYINCMKLAASNCEISLTISEFNIFE